MKNKVALMGGVFSTLVFVVVLSFVSCANGAGSSSSSEEITDGLTARLLSAKDGEIIDIDGEGIGINGNTTYTVDKSLTIKNGNAHGASFVIKSSATILSNIKNINSLIVDKEVGEGDFTEENCSVKTMLVNGGGSNSVHLYGGSIGDVMMTKDKVRIVLEGNFEKAVEGIYSLIGNDFKGTVYAGGDVNVTIKNADSVIAGKIENNANIKIEKNDADIPSESIMNVLNCVLNVEVNIEIPDKAMEEVLNRAPNSMDILSGRVFFWEYYNGGGGENEPVKETGYFLFDQGKVWIFYTDEDEPINNPTVSFFKTLKGKAGRKGTYKVSGGSVTLQLDPVYAYPEVEYRMNLSIKNGQMIWTYENEYTYEKKYAGEDNFEEEGFDICVPYWAIVRVSVDQEKYVLIRETSFENDTISLAIYKFIPSEDGEEKDWDVYEKQSGTVEASYNITGNSLTLEFSFNGRSYKMIGALNTETERLFELTN